MTTIAHGLLFFTIIILIALFVSYLQNGTIEGMTNRSDFQSDSAYIEQIKLLSERFKEVSGSSASKNISNPTAKRPVTEFLSKTKITDSEQCFVNFYSLATRFTGYLGPMMNGYFDPDTAVQLAVNAGSRVFVLEIDYIDDCSGETTKYFPRIVVRDIQGKLLINPISSKPLCNSPDNSTIREVCDKINFYAFLLFKMRVILL